MRVAILDYRAGNLTSVYRALHHLGYDATVTNDPSVIAASDKIIFPGVGAAASCMRNLHELGLDDALKNAVQAGKPVLGICIGMQLLFDRSEEDGGTPCLGLLPGVVRRFQPTDPSIKVPHMGWNLMNWLRPDPVGKDIAAKSHFYFVHSYYCEPDSSIAPLVTSHHGQTFCAGVRRNNLVAFQCHPEKSGPAGLALLTNFLKE